jgi:hypothetical protein
MSFGKMTGSKEYDFRGAGSVDAAKLTRKRFFPDGHAPVVEKQRDSGLPPYFDIKTRYSATPKTSSFETTSRVLIPDQASCQYAPMSRPHGSKLSFQQEDKLKRQRRNEAKSVIRNAHLKQESERGRADELRRTQREQASQRTKQELSARYLAALS